MILRRPILQAATTACSISQTTVRSLHHRIPIRPIPKPTPFIPDTTAFLTAIGRGLSQHASKIPSWDALFTLTSAQLKDLGIEPPRVRKYLLHWREKFRNGEYGIAGDCQHVKDGVAYVRLVEAPASGSRRTDIATATHTPGTRRVILNVPLTTEGTPQIPQGKALESAQGVKGLVVKGSSSIKGPYIEAIKGSGGLLAQIKLQEGIWEIRQGHKVDGGERRKAEVRAKRAVAEKKEKQR